MRRALFAALLALSLYLFLAPVPEAGPGGSDKVGHLLIFGTLALAGRWAGVRAVPLALGLAAYAVTTELLQATLPLGRHGDPADFAADVVGIALGLALAGALSVGFRPRRPDETEAREQETRGKRR